MDLPPSPPMAYPVPPLRLKPPSAAIVISLPSTGPLIWPGWHVPRLYLTWCKWVPKPIYRTSSPWFSPPFFFLHFHLPGSSPHSVSVLWLEPYLQGKIPPLHSQLLFFPPLFLPVFLSVNFCPPPPPQPYPYIHPPPTPTCRYCCVAPIYRFITAAIQGEGTGGGEGEEGRREATGKETQGMSEYTATW